MPDTPGGMPDSIVETQMANSAKHSRAKLGELQAWLSQCWCAVCLGVWLCGLPVLLRVYTLPTLLQRLALARRRRARSRALEMDQAIRVVMWVCHLRPFRGPLFPRVCLRQALALYYVLTRIGYPAEIHFGVYKDKKELRGHSWVTVQGKPVAERTPMEVFRVVYSYPAASYHSSRDVGGPFSREGLFVGQRGA